ncbi:hypothetical protein GGR51DRAFT_192913 [Nemania sp. FL0031]|nr:hypothetical protein GGR51DRAFT_192913 [Nemania sp. FL0031]
MATTIGVRQAPKSSSDIDLIWKTAVAQYEAQTGARVYAATGQTTLEEVWAEISQTKSNFQSFRHSGSKISKIRTHISSAFTPIEALGQVVAHATKAVRSPNMACML